MTCAQGVLTEREIVQYASFTETVVDLQDGEVAEVGSHPELIQRQGLYADMWARQQEAGSASAPSSRAASTADLQSRALQQSPLSRETK